MMRVLLLTCLLCLPASGQVRYEDILKGPGENWTTYAGSYPGWRYSPLKQITVDNAKSLAPKWVYHVPNARGLRSSPIVYKGVMYVTNANSVYALDARSGRLVWQYLDSRAKGQGVNRGAAIHGDRVYFTTNDNYLTALDRQTGVVVFSRKFADENKGTTSTSAPLVVKDKVLVGSAGGDSGVRGFVTALSAETGEELWRTYFVPAKGEPGSETWGDLIEWGGAAAWLSGTFDPELNTLYWTTGNPWPDFTGVCSQRRQSLFVLSCRAGSGHRQDEVALPVHAARHARLGRSELAGAYRHGDWRQDAQGRSCTPTATASSMCSTAPPASSCARRSSSTT